jgi:hypothetical protein
VEERREWRKRLRFFADADLFALNDGGGAG